ncbi:energy transducer TonB [Algibacter sp. 2305UL17-15]|uniref:energy transducer TonB n=1 Tax=Algibacter sp. 2305UL17-15 TaxID=3231268 RepID=UPI003459A5CF
MKFKRELSIVILLLLFIACSSDTDNKEEVGVNQNPLGFDLLGIVNNAKNIGLFPSFSWEAAIDPDGDSVTYDFYLDTNSDPAQKVATDLSLTEYSISTSLELNTDYYWAVVAKDNNGNTTKSALFSFTTIVQLPNAAPQNFNLLTLIDGQTGASLYPSFTWEEAIDPEGDPVTYDFYLDTNMDPSSKLGSDIENSAFEVTTLLSVNSTYYWKVAAKDNKGNKTFSAVFNFKTVIDDPQDIEVPFAVVEEVPIFPGCESETDKKACFSNEVSSFVNDNFNVAVADGLGLTGIQRINLIFKIDKAGNIIDISARGPHPDLENEAIRVIGLLPQMTPGKQRGEAVVVPYSLPIIFQL